MLTVFFKLFFFVCRKTRLERWQRCSGDTEKDFIVLPSGGPQQPAPVETRKWMESH